MLQILESRGFLVLQVEGEKDGGYDGEIWVLIVLQECFKEEFGVGREEGVVEFVFIWKGVRVLVVKFLVRCRVYCWLNWMVVELVQFFLVKDKKKSFIICLEMVKYVIGDLKILFLDIIVRVVEYLWYVFGFELKQFDCKYYIYILINKLKFLEEEEEEEDLGGDGFRLGLLMMILGFIYMRGNSVREVQVWEMLCWLGV